MMYYPLYRHFTTDTTLQAYLYLYKFLWKIFKWAQQFFTSEFHIYDSPYYIHWVESYTFCLELVEKDEVHSHRLYPTRITTFLNKDGNPFWCFLEHYKMNLFKQRINRYLSRLSLKSSLLSTLHHADISLLIQ